MDLDIIMGGSITENIDKKCKNCKKYMNTG